MARHFEWDGRKAAANWRKHRIRFEDAARAFDDEYAKEEVESDEHGEIRWRTAGKVRGTLIVVIYTTREESDVEVVRIISARPATRREYRRYEENP